MAAAKISRLRSLYSWLTGYFYSFTKLGRGILRSEGYDTSLQ